MEFQEVIALVSLILEAYKEAKADGTWDKITEAVSAAESDFKSPALQNLFTHLHSLFTKKV